MMYKFTDQNGRTRDQFQYPVAAELPSSWVRHPAPAKPDGNACGEGRLHLMKEVWPVYAPGNFRCFGAEGSTLLGENKEKAAYAAVRLMRELAAEEIDAGIDAGWAARCGQAGLYMPIAWVRTATYLDRPIDREMIAQLLAPFAPSGCRFVRLQEIRSLRDSIRDSIRDSLGDSLWDSPGASLRDSLWASLRDSLWDSL